ncbi:hypothetical protein [Selenomonas ruminis]|uniref:Uncharacterized protein n=1 Tax=Selenomonas ruminis TaxID=2593411 RepID=A0A5D6WA12_9FIRM|nr:hypothetical protein [Selenomonas sp. mPRGC5]TYZ24746.1 hypothetical protein FZ040_01515 [Selenomonas sp. mPRGC5]
MDKQFGKITVLESTGRKDKFGSEYYWCRCACGNFTIFSQEELESNYIQDCGCGCAKVSEQEEKQVVNVSNLVVVDSRNGKTKKRKASIESFSSRWCGLDGVATNPKHIHPWPEVKRRR